MNTTPFSTCKNLLTLGAVFSLLVLGAPNSFSQKIWDGNGSDASNAWGTADNWEGNTLPLTSETVQFGNGTANAGYVPTAILLGGDREIQNLTIVPNIVGFNIDNNLIGVNTITLNGGGITNNNGNSDVFLNNNFTLAANGNFVRDRGQNSFRNTVFRGSIGESGPARSLTLDYSTGTGSNNHTVRMEAANDYSGGTILKGNSLNVWLNAAGTLGSGDVTFTNTALEAQNIFFRTTVANEAMSKTFANNMEVGGAGSKGLELYTPGGTFNAQANQSVELSGIISSATPLTTDLTFRHVGTGTAISGAGADSVMTMRISGNNTVTTGSGGRILIRSINVNPLTTAPIFLLAHDNALGNAANTVLYGSGGNTDIGRATLLIDGAHTIAQSMTIFSGSAAPESKTIGGTGAFNSTFSGNMTFSTEALGNIVNFTQQTSGGRVTFSGNIIGNANTVAQVVGAGEVVFSGPNNTYAGGTIVGVGTLLVNSPTNSGTGTANVTVESGGTLGGTGRIAPSATAAGITVEDGGIIAPGNSIGTLTIDLGSTTGGLTMDSGAEFSFELGTAGASFLAPGTSDLLAITGASIGDVTFNSTVIDFGGTATAEGFYRLFSTDLLSGSTWSGLTLSGQEIIGGLSATNLGGSYSGTLFLGDGASFGDRDSIYLQVIPEPTTAGMVGISLLAFALLRQRRTPKRRA